MGKKPRNINEEFGQEWLRNRQYYTNERLITELRILETNEFKNFLRTKHVSMRFNYGLYLKTILTKYCQYVPQTTQ